VTIPLDAAYRHCREVTRASATSFYHGMRLLPASRRSAMYSVYAFARRIDDIADGELSRPEKLAALERARADVAALDAPPDADPTLIALSDAARRYELPREALSDLIDGAVMDVEGAAYPTFDDLVVYCRRVGGTIGRLSLAVFGASDKGPRAMGLADDLGVAFQLTNILRDVREDLYSGRLYLPLEDLAAFNCSVVDGSMAGDFAGLARFEAARADEWYARGLALVPLLDRPSASCVTAMAGIYRRLLRRIEREPEAVLAGRLSLPGWEKGWVAARSLVGAGA
jgi:15-cis-phytoene synthase